VPRPEPVTREAHRGPVHFKMRSRAVRVGLELGPHDIRELHALALGSTDQPLYAPQRAQPLEETLELGSAICSEKE